jgi:hypothetical protein
MYEIFKKSDEREKVREKFKSRTENKIDDPVKDKTRRDLYGTSSLNSFLGKST